MSQRLSSCISYLNDHKPKVNILLIVGLLFIFVEVKATGTRTMIYESTLNFATEFFSIDVIAERQELQLSYRPPCVFPNWTGSPYKEPSFIREPDTSKFSSVKFITYVYSTFQNIDRRSHLRNEYHKLFTKNESAILFILGRPTRALNLTLRTHNAVSKEMDLHQDILQVEIPELYENLGYKGIFALHWISKNCQHAQLVAKVDDDIPSILDKIISVKQLLQKEQASLHGSILCGSLSRDIASRNNPNRLKIDKVQYPDVYFPLYCLGSEGTYMTLDVVDTILKTAAQTDVFALDDVYISGLLRLKACVSVSEIRTPSLFAKTFKLLKSWTDREAITFFINGWLKGFHDNYLRFKRQLKTFLSSSIS